MLQQMLANLPERIPKPQMHACLIALCGYQALTLPQLARLMNKKEKSLRKHIKELMLQGELEMRYPDIPNHPFQAYQAPKARS